MWQLLGWAARSAHGADGAQEYFERTVRKLALVRSLRCLHGDDRCGPELMRTGNKGVYCASCRFRTCTRYFVPPAGVPELVVDHTQPVSSSSSDMSDLAVDADTESESGDVPAVVELQRFRPFVEVPRPAATPIAMHVTGDGILFIADVLLRAADAEFALLAGAPLQLWTTPSTALPPLPPVESALRVEAGLLTHRDMLPALARQMHAAGVAAVGMLAHRGVILCAAGDEVRAFIV